MIFTRYYLQHLRDSPHIYVMIFVTSIGEVIGRILCNLPWMKHKGICWLNERVFFSVCNNFKFLYKTLFLVNASSVYCDPRRALFLIIIIIIIINIIIAKW